MTEEFNLSNYFGCDCPCCSRKERFVKEFIKRLKAKAFVPYEGKGSKVIWVKEIDKLAGDKLK